MLLRCMDTAEFMRHRSGNTECKSPHGCQFVVREMVRAEVNSPSIQLVHKCPSQMYLCTVYIERPPRWFASVKKNGLKKHFEKILKNSLFI